MALFRPGRCPQCGYVLRFDGFGYRCDFCGYPKLHRGFTEKILDLERKLKFKVRRFLESGQRGASQQFVIYRPVIPQQACVACGASISLGVQTCRRCGAMQTMPQPIAALPRISDGPMPEDRRILDYIADHNGIISISQACRDLSLPAITLQAAIDRLKAAGFLNQV